jgi:hypothetical protein
MPLLRSPGVALLLLGYLSCLPMPSAATQTFSPEMIAERQARLARWDTLDGDWEGVLAETWQPSNRVEVRVHIKALTITVFVRRHATEAWVRLGEEVKTYLSKEDYVAFIDSVTSAYPGRYSLVFWRRDDNSGDAIFSREVETAPRTYTQMNLRNGMVRRQSPASTAAPRPQR